MAANLLIALGSNRRHRRHGAPRGVIAAAIAALGAAGFTVVRASTIRTTSPLGPGGRSYANAVVAVASDLSAAAAIPALQKIERSFGRRPGRRWGDRVLDLDVLAAGSTVLPSPLRWLRAGRGLIVPHRGLHQRDFVLRPLVEVAPDWRHPVLRATPRQLHARLRRPMRRESPSFDR